MSNIKARLDSLIEIKKELKKYKLDDPVQFPAIEQLNIYFNKYLHGENVVAEIPFEEFNRTISVKLYTSYPENNTVVLTKS